MKIGPEAMDEANRLFQLYTENQELFESIKIVIPMRLGTGVTQQLSDMRCNWIMAGIESRIHGDMGGGFIECVRAQIASDFLKNEPDKKFLIMIDDDMDPDCFLPYLLARHDKPVVGCCALSINAAGDPMLCLTRKDSEGEYRFPILSHDKPIPARGLAEVGHVGTGAICIRRDVLESFQFVPGDTPFYVNEKIRQRGHSNGVLMRGEDFEFCAQVRRKGFGVFVDMEAHVGHIKPTTLRWHDELKSEGVSVDDWVLPAEGMKIGHGD